MIKNAEPKITLTQDLDLRMKYTITNKDPEKLHVCSIITTFLSNAKPYFIIPRL